MQKIFDIVGIGFGPSNLSLAAAIHESCDSSLDVVFLEKQPEFYWHKDMLLDGAEMQISFLKDLATSRNPSSSFTFLNYVHEQGRLSQFINLKKFFPSRVEFNNYLTWVAERLRKYVQYNTFVTQVTVFEHHLKDVLQIHYQDTRTGKESSILAKNIIIATGGTPSIPNGVTYAEDSHKIWHTNRYLSKLEAYKQAPDKPYCFAVVGRGQSAAEIAYDLYKQFPNAQVNCLHRNFSYKPSDDSPFANQVFDPELVSSFYNSSSFSRSAFLDSYQDTNYSVVDLELIEKLYRVDYDDRIVKKQRLHWLPFTELKGLKEEQNVVTMNLRNVQNNNIHSLTVDAVILATGYHFNYPLSLLSTLEEDLVMNANRIPRVSRHYQLETSPSLKAGIYVQGCNEHTHGLTETLLSINAIRANDILQSILASRLNENKHSEPLYVKSA